MKRHVLAVDRDQPIADLDATRRRGTFFLDLAHVEHEAAALPLFFVLPYAVVSLLHSDAEPTPLRLLSGQGGRATKHGGEAAGDADPGPAHHVHIPFARSSSSRSPSRISTASRR